MDSAVTPGGWNKLLDSGTLRANLILASLYLAAFEILQDCVIDRIKNFLVCYGETTSPAYEEALKLHKSPSQASLLWLKSMEAITADDVEIFHKIRHHRNQIAHRLPYFLGDDQYEIDLELLAQTKRLLRKIEVWWIQEVDLPCNPDYDGQEVAGEDIQPGPVILLDLIIQLAVEGKLPAKEDLK